MEERYTPARWNRTKGQRLRLEGNFCEECKIPHFPPKLNCRGETVIESKTELNSTPVEIYSSKIPKEVEVTSS